jgi:hypothetical protein
VKTVGVRVGLVASSVIVAVAGAVAAVDLDAGSEVSPERGASGTRDVLCIEPYYFGGSTSSFSGTNRFRGNIYTLTSGDTLTEIAVELDFTGSANLYFYVLVDDDGLAGPYSVVSETMVPTTGVGQSYYSSGEISVWLSPDMFYAIGVAWGPENVTYVRDDATLPRVWALGYVESSAQGSNISPPITGTVEINPFSGAEYSMTLCFGPVPVELQNLNVD